MTLVAIIIRLLLAVIFFRAAWHKFHDRTRFQAELAAYQLLPAALLPVSVPVVIVLELCSALLLLHLSSAAGVFLAAALLFFYGSAMAINLIKGRSSIDCGCSASFAAPKIISWTLVLRNVILASLALLLLASPVPAPGASSALLVLAGTACALLAYEAIEQAIANSQRYRHWQATHAVKP
jgi:uncharacterized membrane protein YphA (DoxX/SURF4 family)